MEENMSKGEGSDSDDNDMTKAKDWEMISVTSSEPLDYSDNCIFPPNLHEGLPVETTEGLGIANSQQGVNDLTENFEEFDENEAPTGRVVESTGFEGPKSRNFSEEQDVGVSENEGVCGSEDGENFGLKNNEEEVAISSENNGEYLESYEVWGWNFSSGFSGFGGFEGWWKRQAGQPNTLWSIAMAAAIVGVVVFGQRWRSEKWKNEQIKQQLCANDEKISELLCQVARLKEVISGRQKVTVVKSGSS